MEALVPNGDDDLIEKILEGYSLRSVMVPDPVLPTNRPEHVETYDLPHVVVTGRTFWAKSQSTHLFHEAGDPGIGTVGFCYSSVGDFFCSFNPELKGIVVFSKKRYKIHQWKLVRNYGLIWDSQTYIPTNILRTEIENSSVFRIAMLDYEGVWNIHPVDLPMYETEHETFHLKTAMDYYPGFFRNQDGAQTLQRYVHDAGGELMKNRIEINALFETTPFSSFYSLCSDGSYYNFYDILRGTRQHYKRLKVFSDNI